MPKVNVSEKIKRSNSSELIKFELERASQVEMEENVRRIFAAHGYDIYDDDCEGPYILEWSGSLEENCRRYVELVPSTVKKVLGCDYYVEEFSN